MNLLFSVLADNLNLSDTLHYYRKQDYIKSKWRDPGLLRMLVPLGDAEYTAFCIEQLVQIVRHSEYSDMLRTWDPDNTYSFEKQRLVAAQSIVIPQNKTLRLIKRNAIKEIYSNISLSVDSTSVTVLTNGKSSTYNITWLGGVSSDFRINDALNGSFIDTTTAEEPFTASVQITTPPERNIVTLASNLKKYISGLPSEFTDILFKDRPFEVIAAITLYSAQVAYRG